MSRRHYYGRVDPDLTIWPTKPSQGNMRIATSLLLGIGRRITRGVFMYGLINIYKPEIQPSINLIKLPFLSFPQRKQTTFTSSSATLVLNIST